MGITAISATALAVAVSLCVAAPSSSRADDSAVTLALINPIAELNGVKIEWIKATLDGDGFGECEYIERRNSNSCIWPEEIASGHHVLEVLLYPANEANSPSPISFVVKFTAGLTGKWVFDVKGLTVPHAKESDYFREQR
jgi:hypothetical protein